MKTTVLKSENGIYGNREENILAQGEAIEKGIPFPWLNTLPARPGGLNEAGPGGFLDFEAIGYVDGAPAMAAEGSSAELARRDELQMRIRNNAAFMMDLARLDLADMSDLAQMANNIALDAGELLGD
jgi:hypothetical protein